MWGYELSPFVKIVKEVLAELELPYKQVKGDGGGGGLNYLEAPCKAGRNQSYNQSDPATRLLITITKSHNQ